MFNSSCFWPGSCLEPAVSCYLLPVLFISGDKFCTSVCHFTHQHSDNLTHIDRQRKSEREIVEWVFCFTAGNSIKLVCNLYKPGRYCCCYRPVTRFIMSAIFHLISTHILSSTMCVCVCAFHLLLLEPFGWLISLSLYCYPGEQSRTCYVIKLSRNCLLSAAMLLALKDLLLSSVQHSFHSYLFIERPFFILLLFSIFFCIILFFKLATSWTLSFFSCRNTRPNYYLCALNFGKQTC